MAIVSDQEVKIGMLINFKSDVEQYGTVSKISGSTLTLTSQQGFHGDYIGGDHVTSVDEEDCWI